MVSTHRIKAVIACGFLGFVANVATADITVERFVRSGGFAGMGAGESVQTDYIQGIKKRSLSQHKFTGRILSRFGGNRQTTEIVRVDKDLVWTIDDKKKRYTERPVHLEIDADQKTGGQNRNGGPMGGSGRQDTEQDNNVKVIRNDFEVKNTGKSKNINGFSTKQTVMTWTIETENTDTGERNKSVMTTDMWVTPARGAIKTLMREERAFGEAYMKKLGLDLSPGEMQQFGLGMMGSILGASSEKLKKEMRKIKGYPIATAVKWEQAVTRQGKSVKHAESDEDGMGAMSRDIGGMLGSFMKKAMKKDKEKRGSANGMKTVFESYTEIKRIDDKALAKSLFELPAGYKKAKF